MYSLVTVVNYIILYTWNLMKVDLKHSYHTPKKCEVMDALIIFSDYFMIHIILKHYIVHFKYMHLYLSIIP